MADDIKDPKELKEAQEAMDKYVESLKNLHAAEKDHVEAVEKARESFGRCAPAANKRR